MERSNHKILQLIFLKLSRFFYLLPILLLFSLPETYAGEYHSPFTDTLACADCHVMHGTQGGQSMVFDGSAPFGGGSPTKSQSWPRLLKANGIINLCRLCHEDNSLGMSNPTPPDVWNKNSGSMPTDYIPSAGDFADRGIQNEQNRHSIGMSMSGFYPPGMNAASQSAFDSAKSMWGISSTSPVFTCLFCHDQHGTRNFRNLRYDPGNPSQNFFSSTDAVIVNYSMNGGATCSDGTSSPCDIDNTTGAANYDKYRRGNVSFRSAANNDKKRGIAAWCGQCHNDFYGISGDSSNFIGGVSGAGAGAGDNNSGSTSPWLRHPVQDMSFGLGITNRHIDTTNFVNDVRTINPDGVAVNSDDQPFCLSCHYVHGGGNPNNAGTPTLDHTNLIFFDDNSEMNIQPASADSYNTATHRIRNLCQQCHNQ